MDDPELAQRGKLGLLDERWRPSLSAMDDGALLWCLRLIYRKINSKKLRAERDAMIADLRRDGLSVGEPLPKPKPKPTPEPELPSASASTDHPEPEHRNRALEDELTAALVRGEGQGGIYAVYRDWLETRGLTEDGRVTLGPLAGCEDMLTAVEWHMGFIRSCHLKYTLARFNGDLPQMSLAGALELLLDDPGPGRFVQTLTLGLAVHDANDYAEACAVIGRRSRPALRSLEIGDFGYEECELNWSSISDTHTLWPALPQLETLSLRAGTMNLEGIDLPTLRSFTTVTGGLSDRALTAVCSAAWPALERLSLQVGQSGQGASTDVLTLEPLLLGERAPLLTHLGILNCEFTDALCARLPGTPLLARLRSLDLSMGTMTLAGAQALAAAGPALAHLEFIDVDDNYLPEAARPLLAGLQPEIRFGEQRSDEGSGHYYASAFE